MNDCCYQNIDNAVRKGRADYHCPVCDADVTLAMVLMYEANLLSNK